MKPDRIVTLYMKALDDVELPERVWKKLARINQLILDKNMNKAQGFEDTKYTYLVNYRKLEGSKDGHEAGASYSQTLEEAQNDKEALEKTRKRISEKESVLRVDICEVVCVTGLKHKIEEAVESQFPNATDEQKYNVAFLAITSFYKFR